PRDAALIQQPGFNARARAASGGTERIAVARLGERIRAQELERRVTGERCRGHDAEHPETPHVLVPERRAVLECQPQVHVLERLVWRLSRDPEEPAPAHAEVGKEREPMIEIEEQELS